MKCGRDVSIEARCRPSMRRLVFQVARALRAAVVWPGPCQGAPVLPKRNASSLVRWCRQLILSGAAGLSSEPAPGAASARQTPHFLQAVDSLSRIFDHWSVTVVDYDRS